MDLADPQHAVVALAAFLRRRLSGVGDTLIDTLSPRRGRTQSGQLAELTAARQAAQVIVCADEPFAPTSFARARLLRQLHASGLLTEHEAERAVELLQIAQ